MCTLYRQDKHCRGWDYLARVARAYWSLWVPWQTLVSPSPSRHLHVLASPHHHEPLPLLCTRCRGRRWLVAKEQCRRSTIRGEELASELLRPPRGHQLVRLTMKSTLVPTPWPGTSSAVISTRQSSPFSIPLMGGAKDPPVCLHVCLHVVDSC